jgi:hypothetical protein
MRFDAAVEMQKAWNWLWAQKSLASWRNEPWLTATDLHRRVRAGLLEQMEGRAEGEYGHDCYLCGSSRMRVRGVDLADCRTWLRGQVVRGILRADHPGGRHSSCSGLRFRPVGVALTDAEQRTVDTPLAERQRQRNIRHLAGSVVGAVGPVCNPDKPACQHNQKRKPFRGMYRRPHGSSPTTNPAQVTCKKCQKMLADEQTAADANLTCMAFAGEWR